ncbi:uncharacterized protein [Palaemon carinicauda]|uniref:uncharacterized protein isoform X1 n=1 Tax=Palaemon carinicauda TaxID=392227 RepID=UPI0035B5A808
MDSDLKPLSLIEDISHHWVEKMLSQKFGNPVTLHSWKYESPETPEGFMSEIVFLKVVYSGSDKEKVQLSLVVKVLPRELERRKVIALGGLDKREIAFYKFVNTQEFKDMCSKNGIKLQVPEVYYASYFNGEITIVMQDLNIDKYKSGIVKEGNNLAQTKVAVQAIAQLHAAGLAYIEKHGEAGSLADLAEEFKFTCFDEYFIRNLNTLAEMYEGTPLAKSMKSLIPYTKDILDMRKRYPLLRTVVHGDYWAGQLMYSEDGSNVMMIDWQHCNVDNPSSDILSMLFMSSHPSVLEEHLEEVIQSYWESLSRNAEKFGVSLDITYDQLRKNVDDLMLFGFMMVGISIPEFLGGGSLTPERLLGYVNFLERKSIVSKYVEMMEKERHV